MTDLTNRKMIYAKAALLLLGGMLAAGLLVMQNPTLRTAMLVALTVWCFARCYYFAFYVIEHYVDRDYRFSGLWSAAIYLCRERRRSERRPAVGWRSPDER